VRGQSGEKPITSYCPNDAEWFAEMFRVFVTNPDLLRLVRPRTHREMVSAGLKPVFSESWRERLKDAPERTLKAAERQVEAAQ
jgi:predicted lipoprotein